jgi:hypothetical protein
MHSDTLAERYLIDQLKGRLSKARAELRDIALRHSSREGTRPMNNLNITQQYVIDQLKGCLSKARAELRDTQTRVKYMEQEVSIWEKALEIAQAAPDKPR